MGAGSAVSCAGVSVIWQATRPPAQQAVRASAASKVRPRRLGAVSHSAARRCLNWRLFSAKPLVRAGPRLLAHGGHQGIGVGRTVSSVAAVQGLGVAGFLDITARAGGQHPDSRVVPVQDAHQREQQLFRDVMSFYVGQFMGQHTVRTLEELSPAGIEQDGMQRPRHHGAAHQRRGLTICGHWPCGRASRQLLATGCALRPTRIRQTA